MYLLGYDIGSSSIKAALVDANSKATVGVVQCPETEMDIIARQAGWAEQHPEVWWNQVCQATKKLLDQTQINASEIKAIGIAYQMHGLVLVDKTLNILRPSIIWCDSRAVEIGKQAFQEIGEETCLRHLLNSPGNFTASKLKWVKDHEPETYRQIHKMMLPGDFIAMKLTGKPLTTISGLSEGILWDFVEHNKADLVLDYYGIDQTFIPEIHSSLSFQGEVNRAASEATGLPVGIPVTYRAGDQPNNALSLNVLEPGEVAATGGTSGVVYGVVDQPIYDQASRVNGFAHVNHSEEQQRIGILLCINGAGIQYSWMKQQVAQNGTSYNDMERIVASVPVGSDGLRIIPFGNGAERMLNDQNPGSHIHNLQFNRHSRAHFYRAALEGIAFSFVYGMEILQNMGLNVEVIKVGNDNLFQSKAFANTISTLMGSRIEVVKTTGAVGAARAAGVEVGIYDSLNKALSELEIEMTYEPTLENTLYQQAYQMWHSDLQRILSMDQKIKPTFC